jgi:hypothetical protein
MAAKRRLTLARQRMPAIGMASAFRRGTRTERNSGLALKSR